VDIELGGWEEQLILTMTCEDGISVTHTRWPVRGGKQRGKSA
jgi:hypothetical protein